MASGGHSDLRPLTFETAWLRADTQFLAFDGIAHCVRHASIRKRSAEKGIVKRLERTAPRLKGAGLATTT